jgi:uncharacterized protein YndB with AHSA1/START domain
MAFNLVLERATSLPPETLWRGWTDHETLKGWFCPRPWQVVDCVIDLRPGGEFSTTMQGPDGETHAGTGCFLVVEAPHRLVWTSALHPDWRPAPPVTEGGFAMTAITEYIPEPDGGTLYRATVLHSSAEDLAAHEAMGFHAGWSAAFDQLVELMSSQS